MAYEVVYLQIFYIRIQNPKSPNRIILSLPKLNLLFLISFRLRSTYLNNSYPNIENSSRYDNPYFKKVPNGPIVNLFL